MAQDPLEIKYRLWKGQRRYLCPECEWDTYSLDKLQKHIHQHNIARARAKGKGPTLFGPAGNEIDEGDRIVGGDDITEQLRGELPDHSSGFARSASADEEFRLPAPERDAHRTHD